MLRITDPTASAALPAPPFLTGPKGFFTGGVSATRVRAWWLNMMQEEQMSILTAAGIAPDTVGTNFGQVLQALHVLFGGPGLVTDSLILMPLQGGLILQGGAGLLPANGLTVSAQTITLPLAWPSGRTFPVICGAFCASGANAPGDGNFPVLSWLDHTNSTIGMHGELHSGTYISPVRYTWMALGN